MTWSFIPFTYSRELGAEYSLMKLWDSEPSEQSNSKNIPGGYYSQDKLTDAFLGSLFGTMSQHSESTTPQPGTILNDCEPSVTDCAFPADSHVKIFPQREKASELQAQEAAYGKNMPESLGKFDHASRSWKTPPSLFGEGLEMSQQTWNYWGIILSGEFFPLAMSAPRIYGNDFGDLQSTEIFPTPTAHNAKQAVTDATMALNSLDLMNYVAVYPTPCIHGVSGGSGNVKKIREMENLTPEEKRSMQAGHGGKLNPDWVEWIMGWKPGWTKLQPGDFGTSRNTDCPDCLNNAKTEEND